MKTLNETELTRLIDEEKSKLICIIKNEGDMNENFKAAINCHRKIGAAYDDIYTFAVPKSIESLKQLIVDKSTIRAEDDARKEWIEIENNRLIRDVIKHLGGLDATIRLLRRTFRQSNPVRKQRTPVTAEMIAKMEKLFDAGYPTSEIAKTLKLSMPTISVHKKKMGRTKPHRRREWERSQ